MTKAEKLSHRRQLRRRRIAEGLCTGCPNQALVGFTLCQKCREDQAARSKKSYKEQYRRNLWSGAKYRAKVKGVLFEITEDDITIPTHCPVLGTLLQVGKGRPTDNSPSLDRIVPELGYVKGNVRVISYRANKIKNNATVEELFKIIEYMRQSNELSSNSS